MMTPHQKKLKKILGREGAYAVVFGAMKRVAKQGVIYVMVPKNKERIHSRVRTQTLEQMVNEGALTVKPSSGPDVIYVERPTCKTDNCGAPGSIETCPFDSEIQGKETACGCCEQHRRACAEEI